MIRRIVLTGGPGAGKTVISQQIAQSTPDRYLLVPEAATQVYEQMRTRWDLLDLPGRRDVQRRIYQLQTEQESRLATLHPTKTLLLDRGTIDGAAYWPEGSTEYWRDLGTTLDLELARYDAVIWLQTGAVLGCYDGDASNACRFEAPEAAIASGQLLADLWGSHQRMFKIDAHANIQEKISTVASTLERIFKDG
jgi:predicted ATPase